jgi:hypothetical protein
MATKFQNVTRAPPILSAEQAAQRAGYRADQGPQKRDGNRDRRELRFDQQRKRRRIADERAERANIKP